MYQLNPLLEGSVSVRMMMDTKRSLNLAKQKVAYHTKMGNVFAEKIRDMVDKDGALMDKVMFSSLRKSQNHHFKLAEAHQDTVNKLAERLQDIRLSMGTIR